MGTSGDTRDKGLGSPFGTFNDTTRQQQVFGHHRSGIWGPGRFLHVFLLQVLVLYFLYFVVYGCEQLCTHTTILLFLSTLQEKGVCGVKFSGSGCLGVRSAEVHRQVYRFNNGLCLRFNNGLFSSCRTTEILPNFRPSDGLRVLLRLGSRTRVIVIIDTRSVRGDGIHDSLNVACSISTLHLTGTFAGGKLVINDIILAGCTTRPGILHFRRELTSTNVPICRRCLVSNCPSGVSGVMDSGNCNGGSFVHARERLIIVATPNPNDKGVTIYLSRLCRRGGHKIGTKCTGFRAFPV